MNRITLSKTAYMEGLRCPKLLWLRINQPHLAEPPDEQTRHLFSTGHRVEEYARMLFTGGVLIGGGRHDHFGRLVAETQAAVTSDARYLYEAAFSNEELLCRTDILHRWDAQKWNLAEIKMCTALKPEHPIDLAFQCCCVQDSGIFLDRKFLLHINKDYTRNGSIETDKLFTAADLTQEVNAEIPQVKAKVSSLVGLAGQPEPPAAIVGTRCTSPGRCPFFRYCHDSIPEGSVHELPFGWRIIPILLSRGINLLVDIPDDFPLSERQAALVRSAKSGKAEINASVIRSFIRQLRYPMAFLDFETMALCLPAYDNSSPYEKIPFQWSLDFQNEPRGSLRHHEFLAEGSGDPRGPLCESLVELLADGNGSIACWNASFEKSVLARLVALFPHHAQRINGILSRIIDPIVLFRGNGYADYRFGGSASLKKVAPVMAPEQTYTGMTVASGDVASLRFEQFVSGDMTADAWQALRPAMLGYCRRDTEAVSAILNVLQTI